MTGATFFTGGAICDEGMKVAGIDVRFGIELDDAIAGVARSNGHNVITADARLLDINALPGVDCFHFSPPCPSFSIAKIGGAETELDIDLARAALAYIEHHRPRFVTMENVYGYRKSYSALLIDFTLRELGYGVEAWHLNAADYGVPQTRKRLIMVAVLGAERGIHPPKKTHQKRPGFFTKPWVGWREAIKDLLPALPESTLAPWQERRMPKDFKTTLVGPCSLQRKSVRAEVGEPAFTITANRNQNPQLRAVLVSQDYAQPNTSETRSVQTFSEDQPAPSVRASVTNSGYLRAVLVDSQNGGHDKITNLGPDSPAFTVVANMGSRMPKVLTAEWAQVRTVQLSPRCLARFQSIDDEYALPTDKRLACKIIGNAYPSLLTQRVWESLLNLGGM